MTDTLWGNLDLPMFDHSMFDKTGRTMMIHNVNPLSCPQCGGDVDMEIEYNISEILKECECELTRDERRHLVTLTRDNADIGPTPRG